MQCFVKYTQWSCFCTIHCKIFLYYLIGEKNLRENYFLDFSNSSPTCGIRFRENRQHPRMLLSIIYSTSYWFTVFDDKLHSDQLFSCLFPWQVSVKIPVILRISIKFVHAAQIEQEVLYIDKNKKDTYDIRRLHSMNKCIKKQSPDVFCKKIFLKISQNSRKNLCRNLFWIKSQASDKVFSCEFHQILKAGNAVSD